MDTKLCGKCKEIKNITLFSKRGNGFQAWCKSCSSNHNKEWFSDNYKDIAPVRKIRARKFKYGLTEEKYNDMLTQQENKCACCKLAEPVHVDHDHACCPGTKTCGKCVRGLLCQKCNLFIGYLEVNPDLYTKASLYINR